MFTTQRQITPICNHLHGYCDGDMLTANDVHQKIEGHWLEYTGDMTVDEWFDCYVYKNKHCINCGMKLQWEMITSIITSRIKEGLVVKNNKTGEQHDTL